MRAFFMNKFWIILLAILAVVALMGLAVSLNQISFRDGQAFGQHEARVTQAAPVDLVDSVMSVPLLTQVIFWITIVIMVVLITALMSPEMRKKLLRMLFRAVFTYWGLWFLFSHYPNILKQIGLSLAPRSQTPDAAAGNAPVPVFTPPQPVSWVTYLVSFGIAVLLIVLVWKLNSVWKELNAPISASPIKKLAGIARASLRDLSSGKDSTDVIMNCYYRMSDVVLDKKQINRNASVTPSEFAIHLEQAGLPADAVRRLTRLFESVRYGGYRSDPSAVNEAISCLTTILQHCGEAI